MGSWNATCALSHLPITEGEAVQVIILRRNKYEPLVGAGYSSEGLFVPAFLPFRAVYNSYGSVEDIENTANTRAILASYKKRLPSTLQTDWDEFSTDTWTLADVLKAIERKGVRHNQLPDEPKLLETPAFVMVLDKVYRQLANVQKKQEETFYDRTCKTWGAYFTQDWNKATKQKNKGLIEALIARHPDKNGFDCLFFQNYQTHFLYDGSLVLALFSDPLIKKELKQTWIDFHLIQMAKQALRIGWTIPVGAGSQQQAWTMYQKLGQIVNNYCKQALSDYGEY